jgi:hypothetical protein
MKSVRSAALTSTLLAWALAGQATTSTFETGAEGWRAIGDTEGVLEWLPTGGNPGGHVSVADAANGGVVYFVAPTSFLGDRSFAIGTLLTFDLQQVYTGSPNQSNEPDVILQGAGLRLIFNTPTNPANGSWTSYAVPLVFTEWRLNSLTGAVPTATEFASVLGNLTSLQIRAEYRNGEDIGKLDNVTLVPEPASWALLMGGVAGVLAFQRRRRPQAWQAATLG